MTYAAFTPQDFAPFDRGARSRKPIPQTVLCAVALTLSTSAGLWMLYARAPVALSSGVRPRAAVSSAVAPPASAPAAKPASHRDAALFDPTFTSRSTPVTFAQSAPLGSNFEPARQRVAEASVAVPVPVEPQIVPPLPAVSRLVQDVPLPTPRPAGLLTTTTGLPRMSGRRLALQGMRTPVPALASDPGTFFARLFGGAPPPGTALAYAAPEDGGGIANLVPGRPAYGQGTAVYDIAAHTVYLPDGTRLEAHSGLGAMKDDPRSVTAHMRGATPPTVYDLTLREGLFHGVQALRLTPVDERAAYGREGLLAHTYMLGPRGDSNGCVVFKNYRAFLQAYASGQVRRLSVVASLN